MNHQVFTKLPQFHRSAAEFSAFAATSPVDAEKVASRKGSTHLEDQPWKIGKWGISFSIDFAMIDQKKSWDWYIT